MRVVGDFKTRGVVHVSKEESEAAWNALRESVDKVRSNFP